MPDLGTRVRQTISEGADANDSRNPDSDFSRDVGGQVLEGTTISFTAPDTIADSGNGLAVFAIGDKIRISGSASNDRILRVLTVAAGTITTDNQTVTTEAAGATVELRAV